MIVIDNGPEFAGKALDAWAYRHGVKLHFIRRASRPENAYIESFNGKFRDECLNEQWFESAPRSQMIGSVALDYNEVRPHSAIGNLAPAEFARRARAELRSPTAPFVPPAGEDIGTLNSHNEWTGRGGSGRATPRADSLPRIYPSSS
jgi:hypothetical protein